ncbi:hypothetical protein MNV49_002941 [Pseudohyphozyma bogoriensis]|nr:hypothetical protein MNV49_002941 [Pseudohyphozyma bogoriensis]
MLLSTAVVALLASASPALAAFHASTAPASEIVQDAYILQVDASSSALRKRGVFDPAAAVSSVLASCQGQGISYALRQSFTGSSGVFHGASVTVDSTVSGHSLAALEGVTNVWQVHRVKRPSVPTTPDGASSTVSAATDSSSATSTTSTRMQKLKRALIPSADYYGPHLMTGVNNTIANGQIGSGQKIAFVDTGKSRVDYKNPILGGCFGTGCHVSFGYDLVGNDFTGSNTPVPSADPYVTCDPHGTFAMGVAAALPNQYGFLGVAPGATYGMYRIFGCNEDSTDDITLAGYLMAVDSGADVINLSYGGAAGFLDSSPVEMAINTATAMGIINVAATGNYATEGLFFAFQPAAAATAVSVGSTAAKWLTAYKGTIYGQGSFNYLNPTPLTAPNPLRLYFTSTDSSILNDACDPLPASTPALKYFVTVVQRGTCTYATKFANVAAAGGQYVIMYNAEGATEQIYPTVTTTGLTAVVGMTRTDGLALLAKYVKNKRMLIGFTGAPTAVPYVFNDADGGLMNIYSEYGPTNDMFLSPTLTAPGGVVQSTYPIEDGSVAVTSGTSFSSPFVAGAAAVIKAARPLDNLTPDQISGLLSTTAQLTPTAIGSSDYVTVAMQGHGLVQVDLALAARSHFSPYRLLLNDTVYSNYSQTITIRNTNLVSVTYTASVVAADTLGTYETAGDILINPSPDTLSGVAATVSLSGSSWTVAAGASVQITVTVTPPTLSGANVGTFPIYSGFVQFKESPVLGLGSALTYSVPYLGMVGAAFDMPVLDSTDYIYGPGYSYPFIVGNDIQTSYATYTMAAGPTIIFRQANASPLLRIDVVDADVDFTGTISTNNNAARRLVRSAVSDTTPAKRAARALFADTPILGTFYSFANSPRDYLVNGATIDQELPFSGTWTDESGASVTATIGTRYRLLLRALKVTGDRVYEDQWESWLSPDFSFTA